MGFGEWSGKDPQWNTGSGQYTGKYKGFQSGQKENASAAQPTQRSLCADAARKLARGVGDTSALARYYVKACRWGTATRGDDPSRGGGGSGGSSPAPPPPPPAESESTRVSQGSQHGSFASDFSQARQGAQVPRTLRNTPGYVAEGNRQQEAAAQARLTRRRGGYIGRS